MLICFLHLLAAEDPPWVFPDSSRRMRAVHSPLLASFSRCPCKDNRAQQSHNSEVLCSSSCSFLPRLWAALLSAVGEGQKSKVLMIPTRIRPSSLALLPGLCAVVQWLGAQLASAGILGWSSWTLLQSSYSSQLSELVRSLESMRRYLLTVLVLG